MLRSKTLHERKTEDMNDDVQQDRRQAPYPICAPWRSVQNIHVALLIIHASFQPLRHGAGLGRLVDQRLLWRDRGRQEGPFCANSGGAATSVAIARVADVRLDAACHLLVKTNERISDIALRLGYAGPSRFSRIFMRLMKTRPVTYRQEQRDGKALPNKKSSSR
jgi:hypothetical protein